MGRNDCYFDISLAFEPLPKPAPNMEAHKNTLCLWINGSQARVDLCFTAQNKRARLRAQIGRGKSYADPEVEWPFRQINKER